MSIDPITREVPGLTPYQFGGNSPIAYIDFDGLESAKPKGQKDFMNYFIDGVQDGLNEQSEDVSGVYVHEFDSGTIYVGQAKDLSIRPKTSLT